MLSPAIAQGGNFTVAPDDQVVAENASLAVECTFSGNALLIVWTRNGVPLHDDDFNITETLGGTSSVLSFERANHSLHTGEYQCIAVLIGVPNFSTNFSITVKCEFTVSHVLWGAMGIQAHVLWGAMGIQAHVLRGAMGIQAHVLRGAMGIQAHVLWGAMGIQAHVLWGAMGIQAHVLRGAMGIQAHVLWGAMGIQAHVLWGAMGIQAHVLWGAMGIQAHVLWGAMGIQAHVLRGAMGIQARVCLIKDVPNCTLHTLPEEGRRWQCGAPLKFGSVPLRRL